MMGKKFRLVAVTAHHLRAEALAQVPNRVRDFFEWTNWQHVALLVRHRLESDLSLAPEARDFAEDLCSLLVSKGLRGYAGLSILEHHPRRDSAPGRVFFDARSASFRPPSLASW